MTRVCCSASRIPATRATNHPLSRPSLRPAGRQWHPPSKSPLLARQRMLIPQNYSTRGTLATGPRSSCRRLRSAFRHLQPTVHPGPLARVCPDVANANACQTCNAHDSNETRPLLTNRGFRVVLSYMYRHTYTKTGAFRARLFVSDGVREVGSEVIQVQVGSKTTVIITSPAHASLFVSDQASKSLIGISLPLVKMAQKSGCEMCFAPSIDRCSGGNTRLESGIKKFKPYVMYGCFGRPLRITAPLWTRNTVI